MGAFEFFFSFYGLLLGLSVAVIATGLATAIQHRRKIRIGWLTPLLALFVGLDIASFWDSAWVNFRDLPFSYGMLVMGLVITLVYFIAASLVFPHKIEDGVSLDDHFWANKTVVLMLTVVANTLLVLAAIVVNFSKPNGALLVGSYLGNLAFYMAVVIPAAGARRPRLFAIMIGLHMAVYVLLAIASLVAPDFMVAGLPAEPPTAAAR
jgi:hypothetical protein